MSSRAFVLHGRRLRRNNRWPLVGACVWLFLMTLLGAEVAADEAQGVPDEGYGQEAGRGRADGGHNGTGL
ncbi:hypothetical protein THL1_3112 [Pseudomonas sp. TCU-HL1]|nr:hypothetical protein THL1_3112 [Pseudomonas sp. TCU-HL1]